MSYIVYSPGNGYYTGRKYMCKKAHEDIDYYPVFSTEIIKAKFYSSKKRAENFIKSFEDINPLDYNWEIIEVGRVDDSE